MKTTILFFGQIAEITGSTDLLLENLADTNHAIASLQEKFPALKNSKYIIAVDKKIINKNTLLTNNNTIALMPAFSGG
jgi:sulfur-carrier protein